MKPVFQWVYAPRAQSPAGSGERTGNSHLAVSQAGISGRIEQAFDAASSSTGTSFDYLVKTAQRESSMNPAAKAKTSSAAGLFQFIESTWLETLKLSGADHGLGAISDQIQVDARGRHTVADPTAREEILALRHDPEIAAMMAGALTQRNQAYLSERIGRAPIGGELYLAHFLGARGAASLIERAMTTPDASAVDLFPRQAAANRSIFYEDGQERSVATVYADLVSRHGDVVPGMLPQARPGMATAFAADSDGSGVPTAASPEDRVRAGWRAVDPEGSFQDLFRTDTAAGQMASASWVGYAMAPTLFEVAAAEDAAAIAVDEAARAAAAANSSLVEKAAPFGRGPLDLSRFLRVDRS